MLVSAITLIHTWLLLQVSGLTAIAESNRLSRLASESMAKGRYAQAARDYARMVDKLGVKDDAVLANLGQAYLRQHDFANATRAYTRLTLSSDAAMRSLAHNQLAIIATQQKNKGEAAVQLKQALRENPDNQLARLNLARLLKQNPKLDPPPSQQQDQKKQQQQKQQQDQDKQKQDQQKQQQNQQQQQQAQDQRPQDDQKQGDKGQEKKDQEQANKNGQNQNKPQGQTQQGQEQNKRGAQGSGEVKDNDQGQNNDGKKPKEDIRGNMATRKQLKKMQISEEGARQLLEAMRNSEVQYLQQRRHRTQPSNKSGKPNW